jgi:glycolate oxidase iron-sulfur subunit
VQDYPHLLADDPNYQDKAKQVAEKARDLVEIMLAEDLSQLPLKASAQRTAVHTPCTLQHALHLNGAVDRLLQGLGYQLTEVAENHLCCGSAGTYSLTQPTIATQLRERKLKALSVDQPQRIVTANIGCLGQLHEEDGLPVMHWIDLLEQDLQA